MVHLVYYAWRMCITPDINYNDRLSLIVAIYFIYIYRFIDNDIHICKMHYGPLLQKKRYYQLEIEWAVGLV